MYLVRHLSPSRAPFPTTAHAKCSLTNTRCANDRPGPGCLGRYPKSARAPPALPRPARRHLERPVKRREVRRSPAHALHFVEGQNLRVDAHGLKPAPEAPARRRPRVGLDYSPGVGSALGPPAGSSQRACRVPSPPGPGQRCGRVTVVSDGFGSVRRSRARAEHRARCAAVPVARTRRWMLNGVSPRLERDDHRRPVRIGSRGPLAQNARPMLQLAG